MTKRSSDSLTNKRMREALLRSVPKQQPAAKVGRKVVKRSDGSEFTIPRYPAGHPRAAHLIFAALLRRHSLAQAYRYILKTQPEKRAEVRQQINDNRRARKGWAA